MDRPNSSEFATVAFHVSLVGRNDLSGEIYRQIRQAILDGRLQAGAALSPTRELAAALAVSRSTVAVAYERLLAEGFATSHVGAGTFVSREFEVKPAATRKKRASVRTIKPRSLWETISQTPEGFFRPVRFDFRSGLPDVSLFPHKAWRRAVNRALRQVEMTAGGYETPEGNRDLRAAIIRHIGISRHVSGSPDDVIITSGAQQALDIVTRVLVDPGEVVATEDPGYQPAKQLFRSAGARVIGVPVDGEGLVVQALPKGARVVYVTPSHQYPLGVAMSLTRRRALLAWAERNNAVVIEDDYDSEFRFGGRPLEPMQTLDAAGRVVYVGSFSKAMLPSLRLGFMVVPQPLQEAVQKAKFVSDWHVPTVAQNALAHFIEDGDFARHIRKASAAYRERHEMLTGIIRRDFADYLELIPSSTGLHVAARAPTASVDRIHAIASRAFALDVAVQRLSDCSMGGKPQAGVLLGYGLIEATQIAEGLGRLRKCFADDEMGRRPKTRSRRAAGDRQG